MNTQYSICRLCPRECRVNRKQGKIGVCGVDSQVRLARAALHFWEENCISGENGSGTVFFSGCALHCVFCQNEDISRGRIGKAVTKERLAEIYLELQEKGANNINLVTPGQYVPHIVWSVESARRQGLHIPIVYNTGGYDTVESLKQLEGIVDVYLPDFKYWSPDLADKYSHAPDYPEVVKAAIAEMVRQQPAAVFAPEQGHEENQVMQKGVMVRQLLLPGQLVDAKRILRYLYETYENNIYYSLMSQFTPLSHVDEEKYPELKHSISPRVYGKYVDYAIALGIENGFIQEGEVAEESFIPKFDYEGV